MRHIPINLFRAPSLSLALAFVAMSDIAAQSRVVLPAGSVVIVRTTTPLQSASAQNGQTFETTVEEAVGIDEYTVIPAGSRIRGVITQSRAATQRQSGIIEVVFDRLILSDGSYLPITGKLTSTDSSERRQINSNPNARVVLVGGRGGIGAGIAGAGSNRNLSAILAALGGRLSEGRDVDVPAGTALAVELEQAVTLRSRGRRGSDASTLFTGSERVSSAQQALTRLNYYRGPVNGRLDDATRRALFEFQVDRRLNATGNLDGRTAQALGLNVSGGVGGGGGVPGSALSADDASALRRDAQSLVARHRSDIGASAVGRLNAGRTYTQGDLEFWFALSAFADNASVYEQVVRNGGNPDATVLAGRSLIAAARRVDAALQNTRTSATVQTMWTAVRRRISVLDTR
jgi:peptidoglycan hydrolase-like protein with peptidoglycan-binding domain